MTMKQFYDQLVGARQQPNSAFGPLVRLMQASLAQARRLHSELAWEVWQTGRA